jgi:hypothetical protein
VTYAGDLAEMYPSLDDANAGDIVMLGSSAHGASVRKAVSGDGAVLGVVSTKPGVTLGIGDMGSHNSHSVAVALNGRVPVRVSLENGPIRAGMMLAASSEPGRAARAIHSGQVIGFALEDAADGSVLCFVKPQYWVNPSDYESLRHEVDEIKAQINREKK